MANPLYNEFGPVPQGMSQDFMTRLNTLKQSVSDPNAMINGPGWFVCKRPRR